MQSRRGPPIFQPFYDVLKLCQKENVVVRRSQNYYIFFFLLLAIFTGGLFFGGADLLLVIFALTLAAIFFVLGAYKASSPYSFIGAERELIQMMAYEPMVLLTAIGMYMVTKSFAVNEIASHPTLLVLMLPGIFLGFLYTLEIKFRKSPFDLSCSHHAHQELVRGITTEFSGRTLAMIEIAHWYESVFLLGWVYLFFGPCRCWVSPCRCWCLCSSFWWTTFLPGSSGRPRSRAPGWSRRCWALATSLCSRFYPRNRRTRPAVVAPNPLPRPK